MTDRRASIPSSQTSEEPPAVPLFGDVLRRFRRAVGLTQEELAEQATLSPRAISDLERGERRWPQRETVHLLAEALHLAPPDRMILEAAARGRDNAASARRAIATSHNLPAPVTPIVGRVREITEVTTLVRNTDVRLATITGPGGVGKTRLALAVATVAQGDFPDGVYFVSLASVRDPDDLITTVAQTLGVEERGGRSAWDNLRTGLQERRILLVLDNFEHLLGESVIVANLLAYCSQMTILVTSRAALHLRGEHEYLVSPLATPDPHATDVAALAANPAVTLFCQRARAARQDFALTAENAATVARICVRLDGLPLAIELAAARVKFFPLVTLLTRLDTRLPELADGPRDAPERQRTMWETIAWSERLLDDDERALFRQLAVFVGGWTRDAAEAVCAQGSRLISLVDKSLVRVESGAGDEPRFMMLETIHEYAISRSIASDETARRHAAYFLACAEDADRAMFRSERAMWLQRLEHEQGNFRAALGWLRAQGDAERGLRLSATLRHLWSGRGRLTEGRAWLTAFIGVEGASDYPFAYAQALLEAGRLAHYQGDYQAATTLLDESLTATRAQGDRTRLATVLGHRGHAAFWQEEYAVAQAHYTECLALRRALGEDWGIAVALNSLGTVALHQGDYATACTLFNESLAIARRTENTHGIAHSLKNLGRVSVAIGDYERARALSAESLRLFIALRNQRDGIAYLEALAEVAVMQDQPMQAAQLLGAAETWREVVNTPLPLPARADYARTVAATRAALSAEMFRAAWETGAALPPEQIVAEAIGIATPSMC